MTYRGITTYEVNMERMATTCVNTLLEKIQKRPFVKGIQIVTGEMVLKRASEIYPCSKHRKELNEVYC